MAADKDLLGRFGENVAARTLQAAGYRVLDRNWRCPLGEIDIVARDGDAVVFCEVKTRRGLRFGAPVETVTPAKARRQRRLAVRWLAERRPHCGSVRFDVVGVLVAPDRPVSTVHLRGVAR